MIMSLGIEFGKFGEWNALLFGSWLCDININFRPSPFFLSKQRNMHRSLCCLLVGSVYMLVQQLIKGCMKSYKLLLLLNND